jgi:hypothetical protein
VAIRVDHDFPAVSKNIAEMWTFFVIAFAVADCGNGSPIPPGKWNQHSPAAGAWFLRVSGVSLSDNIPIGRIHNQGSNCVVLP